jgi:hypothetical protein
MSSCCTLGKNNIALLEDAQARAEFSDGKGHLDLTVRDGIVNDIATRCDHHNEEEMALHLFSLSDMDLFEITSGRSAPFGR